MSDFIIRFGGWIFIAFMVVGLALLLGIASTFNGGLVFSLKYLCAPLAIGIIIFVKANIYKIKVHTSWSDMRIWLFSLLIFYPSILVLSWPYVLVANALLSSSEVVEVGGVVNEKFITRGKGGLGYHLGTTDVNTSATIELNVSKSVYKSVKKGDMYYSNFYKGAFGIPWHWRGNRPNKTLQVDR